MDLVTKIIEAAEEPAECVQDLFWTRMDALEEAMGMTYAGERVDYIPPVTSVVRMSLYRQHVTLVRGVVEQEGFADLPPEEQFDLLCAALETVEGCAMTWEGEEPFEAHVQRSVKIAAYYTGFELSQ